LQGRRTWGEKLQNLPRYNERGGEMAGMVESRVWLPQGRKQEFCKDGKALTTEGGEKTTELALRRGGGGKKRQIRRRSLGRRMVKSRVAICARIRGKMGRKQGKDDVADFVRSGDEGDCIEGIRKRPGWRPSRGGGGFD